MRARRPVWIAGDVAVNGLVQVIGSLGAARLVTIAVVGLLSAVFFAFILGRIGGADMALLYSDLSMDESSKIIAKLDSQDIDYELRGDGSQIFVPRDAVLRLRMNMAQEGLPTGGSVGYEIFDDSDGFGASSFVNNVNKVRALEGELARTIRSMGPVSTSRVHLVLPQRELFSRDTQEPSASIFLKTHAGAQPTPSQVLAIQHVVAAAVPGLKPGRISVVDDRGNLLARGESGEEAGVDMNMANANQLESGKEAYLARQIEEMLERTVGPGRADVTVNLKMNFDRVTINKETYDPDGAVVRSSQVITDTSQSQDRRQEEMPVSVSSELPQPDDAEAQDAQSSRSDERTEEMTNYEISRTMLTEVQEAGDVERVSVAVLVDGTYTTNPDGTRIYQERPPEEIEQITALVRSAIGFDAERGDAVSVVNMRFAEPDFGTAADEDAPMITLRNDDYLRIGEIVVLGILGILVLLLVLRPLVQRLFDPSAGPASGRGGQAMLGSGAATAQLAGPGGDAGQQGAENSPETMIDLDQVEGRVRASSLRKIGDLVEKHPDETVSIIRNWMYQQ